MTSEENINRSELIKSARESCIKNIPNTKASSTLFVHSNTINNDLSNENPTVKVREFITYFKIILAVVIFASIVIIDKFNINLNDINSEIIKQNISYNTSIKDIGEFVKKINAEKVIEVFKSLD